VINLSADKDQVLREAFRVLKPGGRFAVSDVVTRGHVPEQLRQGMVLWGSCIAGALEEGEYRSKLKAVGFEGASIEPTRVYRIADAREFLAGHTGPCCCMYAMAGFCSTKSGYVSTSFMKMNGTR
jgi:ubiquinone/menaquinone biosynthesis C-methylase UbiE